MSRIEDALAKANKKRSAINKPGKVDQDYVKNNNCRPPTVRHLWLYTLGAALVVAAVIFHNVSFNSGVRATSENITTIPTAADSSRRDNRLPSCIPLNAPGNVNSSGHSGWNSYGTSAMEFRVFREGGVVRAIQVLARKGKVIPDDFFASFISEISNRDPFKIISTNYKKRCVIEKGFAGKVAEIIRYRNKPDGTTTAFVVSYL